MPKEYVKTKDVSVQNGFWLPQTDQRGISQGYMLETDFNDASRYVDSNVEDFNTFGRFPFTRIIEGGTYLFGTGSLGAPALAPLVDPDTGIYWPSAGTMSVQVNGVLEATFNSSGLAIADMTQGSVLFAGASGQISQNNASFFWDNTALSLNLDAGAAAANVAERFRVSGDTQNRFQVSAAGYLSWGSGSAAVDASLRRLSTGQLSQLSGTTPQEFILYNTTDSDTVPANYERARFLWSGNTFFIAISNAGTGVRRDLKIDGATVTLRIAAADAWIVNSSSHLMAATDNSFDIGASGATRPRTIYPGTSIVFPTDGTLAWGTTGFIRRTANNTLAQSNTTNAQTTLIYNTTDSDTAPTNFERFQIAWSGNVCFLRTQAGGTGTQRNMSVGTVGSGSVFLHTAGLNRWEVTSGGLLRAVTDNSVDIGATGATRPRTMYLGTDLYLQSDTSILRFGTSADVLLSRDAAAVLALVNGTTAQTMRIYGTTTGPKYTLVKHDGTDGTVDVAASSGKLILGGNASDIQWGKALVALGGGAAPTLGTIGGSGPATAAQNSWMQVKDSAGNAFWVPVWK